MYKEGDGMEIQNVYCLIKITCVVIIVVGFFAIVQLHLKREKQRIRDYYKRGGDKR